MRAEQDHGRKCDCLYEGLVGIFCDVEVPHFCVNQCNGRGECNGGFCHCQAGWHGADCGVPAPNISEPSVVSRLKPLIYVYDLPAEFHSQQLQRRQSKKQCVHRTYHSTEEVDGGSPSDVP
ncbi:hypothetical protein CYMTET_35933, partial [Cymbomonas tetramitiformis]